MKFPIKILFICLGNICRSPAAEGAFKKLITEKKLTDYFVVDSAGTSGYHDGELADPRTREVARKRGIKLDHISRKLRLADFQDFNYLIAMDQNNKVEIQKLAKTDDDRSKIYLFREFSDTSKGLSVPDPYYGDIAQFENVQDIVETSSKDLLEYLIAKHQI